LYYKNKNYYRNPKIYSFTPKREKQINISGTLIKVIVFLVLIGIVIWLLFFSPFLKIKNIEIDGTLNPEVKAEIDQFYGKNIFLFRPAKVQEELSQKQTSVKNIEIYRGLPDTLKVKVYVREPVLGWKSGDKNYFIDNNGVIFELHDSEMSVLGDKKISIIEDTKNIPVVPGNVEVSTDFVKFVTDFSEKLKNDFNIQIKSIKISETTLQIEVETDQGFRIILATDGNLDNQLRALKKVIDEKKSDIHEYADLRIEGRVYYK
jgi:cell division septal protein FtsQ